MPNTKLISLSEYRKKRFTEGSAPDPRTLKKLIENGELQGKQLGKVYFIEVDDNNAEYDPFLEGLMSHG